MAGPDATADVRKHLHEGALHLYETTARQALLTEDYVSGCNSLGDAIEVEIDPGSECVYTSYDSPASLGGERPPLTRSHLS